MKITKEEVAQALVRELELPVRRLIDTKRIVTKQLRSTSYVELVSDPEMADLLIAEAKGRGHDELWLSNKIVEVIAA